MLARIFFSKLLTLFALFVLLSTNAMSQSESYGTWTSIGIEKDYKKWNFSADTELRTVYYMRLVDRWSVGASADYSFSKYLKLGAGYQFMNSLDQKYLNYQYRNRFNVSAGSKLKFNDFTFSLRERVQMTLKDDSKRIKADGTIDTYSSNPEFTWRNRMQLSYNIPHSKLTPAFSVESFYQLNNPDGNSFDNLRYILSFDYKLKKRKVIELYGVVNSELQSEDATGKYILGIAYTYTLK